MNSNEPPVLDGSSMEFIDIIQDAGITKQNSNLIPIVINKKIEYNIALQINGRTKDILKLNYTPEKEAVIKTNESIEKET